MKSILLVLLVSSSACHAGDTTARQHSLFLEFFGSRVSLISLNYARTFPVDEKISLSAIAGLSPGSAKHDNSGILYFPVTLTVNRHFGKSAVEVGGGVIIGAGNSTLDSQVVPEDYRTNFYKVWTMRAGYRYQGNDHFLVRLAPALNFLPDPPVGGNIICLFTIGFSVGFSF